MGAPPFAGINVPTIGTSARLPGPKSTAKCGASSIDRVSLRIAFWICVLFSFLEGWTSDAILGCDLGRAADPHGDGPGPPARPLSTANGRSRSEQLSESIIAFGFGGGAGLDSWESIKTFERLTESISHSCGRRGERERENEGEREMGREEEGRMVETCYQKQEPHT